MQDKNLTRCGRTLLFYLAPQTNPKWRGLDISQNAQSLWVVVFEASKTNGLISYQLIWRMRTSSAKVDCGRQVVSQLLTWSKHVVKLCHLTKKTITKLQAQINFPGHVTRLLSGSQFKAVHFLCSSLLSPRILSRFKAIHLLLQSSVLRLWQKHIQRWNRTVQNGTFQEGRGCLLLS